MPFGVRGFPANHHQIGKHISLTGRHLQSNLGNTDDARPILQRVLQLLTITRKRSFLDVGRLGLKLTAVRTDCNRPRGHP